MILTCDCIELSVVNTYPPTRRYPSRDEFILIILDYGDTGFLGYDLGRADPLAIRDWIDDTHVQKF
ncbi:hypothetical protein GCM10010301_73360 [Streptomyces plicatus]|nr:hypothetical protein GCM10010301_73360 [Streptomyces plicatus]